MKSTYDISKNKYVTYLEPSPLGGYHGTIAFRHGDTREFVFVMTVDSDNWEHVSVHIQGEEKEMPTWDDMCRIKDIFWHDHEEVHQIHPAKANYVHKFGDLENILHLWRPVGGWKEV